MAKTLDALHLAYVILDRLGIGEVALLCGMAHQQMVQDQPGDQLGLAFAKAEARAQFTRHIRTEDRVIASATLGDIVQESGDIGDPARRDLVDQAGCARMVGLELPLLDLA